MKVKWSKNKIKIGEKLMLKPFVCLDKQGKMSREPIEGTIVYINRPHRYFTAEFVFPYGSFRESFKFVEEGDLACQIT